MRWIYILKCSEEHYYVGETTRLYRRFWEHIAGKGGLNTSLHIPKQLVGLYRVSTIQKFIEYNNIMNINEPNIYFDRLSDILNDFNYSQKDIEGEELDKKNNLTAETYITECLMVNSITNWKKIRGAKYSRFDAEYEFPQNSDVKDLPLCKCGIPCDVRTNEDDSYIYFRCSKKNIWDELRNQIDIDIDEPCNYFSKYTKDIQYNKLREVRKTKIFNLTKKSPWLKELVGSQYEYCIGGCGKEYNGDYIVRYDRRAINLCFDCFVNRHNELSKKYEVKCLI
jgi:hypothetical protein